MDKKLHEQLLAFGFSGHNLTLMGSELSLLWPGRGFRPCANALELSLLREELAGVRGILLNLSREYNELFSAFRFADNLGIPVIGAVAVDYVNLYSLDLCMAREVPAVIGELEGNEELGEARSAIRDGHRFVSRSLLRKEGYRFVDFVTGFDQLSEREALCVNARLGGLSAKEISYLLGVEPSSVTTYTSRAYGKLGVTSGEELVWLFSGRPMGSYHCFHSRRLFPSLYESRRLPKEQKKPEQAKA
ncbi:MAG: helix-turn-helix transcriptional regulator [Treponema sp.]|nr:helix-turn-helix transcriptional regulator [Treponema sp.]